MGGILENCLIMDKTRLKTQLKRIQGQIGGISKMIDEDKSCEAVLTQIAAAMSSIKGVGSAILAEEAKTCGQSTAAIDKYAQLLKRYI